MIAEERTTPLTPPDNSADLDLLHDLDRADQGAGKSWSVAFAKKLGLSRDEIERFLGVSRK